MKQLNVFGMMVVVHNNIPDNSFMLVPLEQLDDVIKELNGEKNETRN